MPKTKSKKRSVTIQVEGEKHKTLEEFALNAGHTYMGEGNVSWGINQAIDFLIANFDEYQKQLSEKMSQSMRG